ncbi:MAG: FAD-dependent oxidoreductase [Clostridiales bacterium]|nr:FAD-dependent oxidoreductase [Clostridiales bacterium]
MESLWLKDSFIKPFEPLKRNIKTDVVIIGAGMAGILCAHELKKRGVRAAVIEGGSVGSGQTKNTTAKITAQHGIIYSRLFKNFGAEYARLYAQANMAAIEKYAQIIKENGIDCNFERRAAVLYSEINAREIKDEALAAIKAGIPCRLTDETELPLNVRAALVFENQAQFNPLKFLGAVAEQLEIYENTYASAVTNNTVYTNGGTITGEFIIFACHYPFINFPGLYFLKMSRSRSYCLASQADFHASAMYYSNDPGALSVRSYNGFTIFAAEAHRTGKAPAYNPFEKIKETACRSFGRVNEYCRWSAQDCVTLDNMPYIGRFSIHQKNWLVLTGFNKWGMTSSAAGADIISDMVCGKKNKYEKVFAPDRFNFKASYINAAANFKATASAYAGRLLPVPAPLEKCEIPRGTAAVVLYKGKKAGAYRDDCGALHIVSLKCPHMGCALKWNAAEKSWDCPCHGSRFDYRGRLIDNPAQSTSIIIDTPGGKN